MKKKKTKKFRIRRILAIIILLFTIIFLKNLTEKISIRNQHNQMQLLLDNESITLNNNIYVENDVIYISEEDIKNIFDKTIYYNVGDKELITTYNKHVAVMHLNENKMQVNDSETQIQGVLREIDSKIYLPITDLEIVYDIEIEFSEQNNVIIIDSLAKYKSQVIALDDAKLKMRKSFFSPTIEKVKRGDYLFVIEQDGNNKKVRTESGNIGYIKNKKVSEEEVLREDLQTDTTKINILKDCSDITNINHNIELETENENVAIIDSFNLTKGNAIFQKIDVQSAEYQNYFQWATENNIEVVSKFQNNITVSSTLVTYSQRKKIINELYDKIIQNQHKGVCIDFEEIDDINSFYRFLIELTPKFKESGLKVIVKTNKYMDEEKVKNIVDFTF